MSPRLFVVPSSSADRGDSTDGCGFNLPLFQFEDVDGHLLRALSPLEASSFFRNLYENWRALRDNSVYLVRTAPKGPLGQSASIFGKDYPARRSIYAGAFPLSALILLLIGLVGLSSPRVFPLPHAMASMVTLIAPYIPPPQSKVLAKKKAKGGGGGGDRSPLLASKGRLPRFAAKQFVPPAIVQSDSRLVMEPTLVGPPDIAVPQVSINWGDPFVKLITMSNGPGFSGGMGSGSGGGIGSGNGPGYGAGSGGGINSGNGGIVAGGGVIPPRATHRVSPQYTAEAFAAKIEGKVVLQVLVMSTGQARVVRVVDGLPLGLTEKAIEAVGRWTFEAGRRNGQAIAMEAQVTIYFRL